jgi:hypothetical protein
MIDAARGDFSKAEVFERAAMTVIYFLRAISPAALRA